MPTLCQGGPRGPDGTTPATATSALLSHVDHLVVVVMENRSFDNFLGGLRLDPAYPGAALVDGLTGEECNPDADGNMVKTCQQTGNGTLDPRHDWVSSRAAFNVGRNDGFVRANPGAAQAEVMGYLGRDQLPFLHALAAQSTVCDRWFSSVMGPTWPNRFYLHAGTSQGRTKNRPMGLGAPATLWERLGERCWSGKNYYAGAIPWYSVAFPTKSFSGTDAMVPEPVDGFFRDAAAGNLPNFSIIDPDFELNDGHPPHELALAEAFISSIHRALMAAPTWSRTLLVVTFDEHGGFYDHVAPPLVPDPDPNFQQLGFRVPAIVAGPMVRAGQVVSTPFEHLSIAATLRARFGIESLGMRMDAANDLGACIDPARVTAAITEPTALLPAVVLPASMTGPRALRATSQPEMMRLALKGGVPLDHVDTRPALQRMRGWLRHAQELEAVRVRG
jgi:phospholipase C